ncbi:hypothetical protein PLEOSDRAFT_1074827 [Pleurotus ostreatus PC15]|uniref:GP-PDE domain-containing protein n=2 Tax=Pleurotus TaxID=5320 RepID=A0A067NTZ2_PLEO1|nr:hypothetical protein CCMSSC00406_0000203 [Pleurotus cornucopiae]KDQ30475.1 hypothetical protein PLEOSDRAFT_1074827 [Pleurotus ostreatus PC15]
MIWSALQGFIVAFASSHWVSAAPATHHRHVDIQGHRGGRGNTVENTLPSFAWGLINGAETLELDNGVTKDGVVVVWHDEDIEPAKCVDTKPAFPGDPLFPYVGKFIANLTLAQVKTLDCGSERLVDFPFQLTYPKTRISTLKETFDFVECADPQHKILWNIESKIDAQFPNLTRGVQDFVQRQHALFVASPYRRSITFQSFDWRSLIAMKKLDPSFVTSALIQDTTAFGPNNTTSPWLAGLRLDSFPGPSVGAQVAQAAHSIGAGIVSSSATAAGSPGDPARPGFVAFTDQTMIDEAHKLGLTIKPWTVDSLNLVERLVKMGVDGIITDFPDGVRRWAQQQGLKVAPKFSQEKVLACLAAHTKSW